MTGGQGRSKNVFFECPFAHEWQTWRYEPARFRAAAVPVKGFVVTLQQMSNAITVRLPEDLAEWLDQTARKTGVPKGRNRSRRTRKGPQLRTASVPAVGLARSSGPEDLSTRKGFSRK